MTCPQELQVAKTSCCGMSFWALQQQVSEESRQLDRDEFIPEHLAWDSDASDILMSWKQNIRMLCTELDPKQRMALSDALEFWKEELWIVSIVE